MSQISPPIRILVVAVLGLMAAWMVFLRPSPEAEQVPAPPAATAPGVEGLGNAVEAAEGAAAAQEARDGALQSATGEDVASGSATGAAAKASRQAAAETAAKLKAGDLPAPIVKGVASQKVMVLLFWNRDSADDRAVKRAVARVDRWGGEVVVHTAPIGSVSKYSRITRGAEVEQSPTVVVVDRELKAETLVGFNDTLSIDQAVVDAMRNSGVLLKDKYLRAINEACATAGVQQSAIVQADAPGRVAPAVNGQERVWERFMTRFKAVPAPARWKALKRASLRDGAALAANLEAWAAYLGAKPSAGRAVGSVARFQGKQTGLAKSFNARMDKHNVLSCGSQT